MDHCTLALHDLSNSAELFKLCGVVIQGDGVVSIIWCGIYHLDNDPSELK